MIGTRLKNPLKNIVASMVINKVINATAKNELLYVPVSGLFMAMSIATGANPNPITIITGPTTIGGRILIIQLTPLVLIKRATSPYTRPAKKLPTIAPSGPFVAVAAIIGPMKAKDEPK